MLALLDPEHESPSYPTPKLTMPICFKGNAIWASTLQRRFSAGLVHGISSSSRNSDAGYSSDQAKEKRKARSCARTSELRARGCTTRA
eukprot:3054513-Amphidinium_carterae.1